MRFKSYVNILWSIKFFYCIQFTGLSIGQCISEKKKPWDLVGFIGYSDCTSYQHHGDVLCFVKALLFRGEIKKQQFDTYNFTRLVTQVFYIKTNNTSLPYKEIGALSSSEN